MPLPPLLQLNPQTSNCDAAQNFINSCNLYGDKRTYVGHKSSNVS